MLRGPNAALLPDEIKCAIVEGYLDTILNRMEQLGGPIGVEKAIINPVEIKPQTYLLIWQLETEPGSPASKVYLGTDEQGLKKLSGLFRKFNNDTEVNWIDQIEVPTTIRFGSKKLKLSQIAELEVLDIIVTDSSCSENFSWELSMYVCGSLFCSGNARFNERIFEVKKIVRFEMQTNNIDQKVESNTQDTSQAETDFDAETRLDNLSVEMIFEIGRKHISIGTLKKMTPGYVVDLSSDLSGPIQIYLGGRLFGTGQLVRVDDSIGIRLLEIYAKKDAHV